MKRRLFILCGLAAGGFLSILFLTPDVVVAQADKVKSSMAALIAKTGALGTPKIEGNEPVGGKDALLSTSAPLR